MYRHKLPPLRRATTTGSFQQIVKKLQKRYEARLCFPNDDTTQKGRQFLPGGAAKEIARDTEVARLVKELFLLSQAFWAREESGLVKHLWSALRGIGRGVEKEQASAEAFHRNILGHDLDSPTSRDGRVELLATLILSDVQLDSQAWRVFVSETLRENASATRFCDRLLRFREIVDVQHCFGGDDSCRGTNRSIYENQFIVRPYYINGEGRMVPDNARWPFLEEKRIIRDDEPSEIYQVKIDQPNFRGSIPSDWIVRKVIPSENRNEEEIEFRLRRQMMTHTHIRKIYGFARCKDRTSIFMPCASCSLQDHMEREEPPRYLLREKVKKFELILGVADALKFLHHGVQGPNRNAPSDPIRHGDIKASNILVEMNDDSEEIFKLCDFGISAIGRSTQGGLPLHQLVHLPPEFLADLKPTQDWTIKGDIWSFACLCLDYLAWLADGLVRDGGRKGLKAFYMLRRNTPPANANDIPNRRFFVIEEDPDWEENNPNQPNDDRRRQSREFYTRKDTDNGVFPLVMKLNPAVTAYFERITGENEQRPIGEKRFIWKTYEALVQFALVPNPLMRGTMEDIIDRLSDLISEYGRMG